MKQKIRISFLVLMLLFLAGCDKTTTTVTTNNNTNAITNVVTDDTTNPITTQQTTDPVMTLLPILSLVGDDVIIVQQYTIFVDPGAVIVGGYALDITSDADDVDTSVLGDYTVTYSVVFNGVTYTGTRTVRVVEPTIPVDFGFSMTTLETTYNSISVQISYTDTEGILHNAKASLYDGDTLITSYDLNSGDNYLNYNDLDADTEYTLVLEGSYVEGGATITLSGNAMTISTLIASSISFTLQNEEFDSSSYQTDVLVTDAASDIVSMTATLYQGETVIDSYSPVVGESSFDVDNLLAETGYVLKVTYTYAPADGGVNVTETLVLSTFTTEATPVPVVTDYLCVPDTTTIDCTFVVDETGLTDVALRVEVWVDGSYNSLFHASDNNTTLLIDSLLPGTEYTLKLYTDYKLAGTLDQIAYVLLDEITVTTLDLVTYTTPSINNLDITQVLGSVDSVTFEFDLEDPDATINGYIVIKIYKDGSYRDSESITVGHNVITFSGSPIAQNTAYTFTVVTNYKESEDVSKYDTVIYEGTFLMNPQVEATNFELEQSIYYFGDQIRLELELDNPDDMTIEYVTINGTKIYKEDFIYPTHSEKIYINMGAETSYTDYSYHITNFAVTMVDDSSYVIAYDQTVTFRLQQPGDVDPDDAYVKVLDFTTDDLTIRYFSEEIQTFEVAIYLDNEFDLEITSINVNSEEYTAAQFNEGSSNKVIYLNIELYYGAREYTVNSVTFLKNDVVSYATNSTTNKLNIYSYDILDAVPISTAVELNSIDPSDNCLYVLSADIDMTGIDFTPIGTYSNPFLGVFDGNGFTISNLTITSSEAEQVQTPYLGLFGYSTAMLYDITLSNVTILVTTNENHYLNIGTLAGKSVGTVIECSTIGNSSITINGFVKGAIGGLVGTMGNSVSESSTDVTIAIDSLNYAESSEQAIVGGLIGIAVNNYVNLGIDTSSSAGSITITNADQITFIIGGLAGIYEGDINYSYSAVTISTPNTYFGNVGGLVGRYYPSNLGITGSYASGDIYSSSGYIGGLIGDVNGTGGTYITNSFYVGNISCDNGYVGRIFGYFSDEGYFSNCYTYDVQTVTDEYGPMTVNDKIGVEFPASATEYNDEDFYTRLLEWNAYYYDFSTLDIVNGDLPVHK